MQPRLALDMHDSDDLDLVVEGEIVNVMHRAALAAQAWIDQIVERMLERGDR